MKRILILYLITSAVIITVAATVVGVAYSSGLLSQPIIASPASVSPSGTHISPSKSDSDKGGSSTDKGGSSTDKGKSTKTMSQEIREAVDLTNAMRAQQSLPAVTHDDELAEHATAWAQWMATNGKFCHPGPCNIKWPELQKYIGGTSAPPSYSPSQPLNGDGQNIAIKEGMGETISLSMSEAVEEWYNECQCCARPSSNNCQTMTMEPENGHYTQLMWPSTLKVGFGKATGKFNGMDAVWVVCNYSPAGNLMKSSTEFADGTNFKGFVSGQKCPWGSKKNEFMSSSCCGNPCYGNPSRGGTCATECDTS